jgi:hypothetical protein
MSGRQAVATSSTFSSPVGPLGFPKVLEIPVSYFSGIVFTCCVLGVILINGSIIESLVASREVFGTLDGRVLQFANYTFDITVWVRINIQGPLLDIKALRPVSGVLH